MRSGLGFFGSSSVVSSGGGSSGGGSSGSVGSPTPSVHRVLLLGRRFRRGLLEHAPQHPQPLDRDLASTELDLGLLDEARVELDRLLDVASLLVHATDVEQVVGLGRQLIGLLEQRGGLVVLLGLKLLDRLGDDRIDFLLGSRNRKRSREGNRRGQTGDTEPERGRHRGHPRSPGLHLGPPIGKPRALVLWAAKRHLSLPTGKKIPPEGLPLSVFMNTSPFLGSFLGSLAGSGGGSGFSAGGGGSDLPGDECLEP